MARKTPTPRPTFFYGIRAVEITCPDGTWVEPEERAYPNGGMSRRAYANFSDGKRRVVKCSIPDTAYSIPAVARIRDEYLTGFITIDDERGVVFNQNMY